MSTNMTGASLRGRTEPIPEVIVERFYDRLFRNALHAANRVDDDCHIWCGGLNRYGYGQLATTVDGVPHLWPTHMLVMRLERFGGGPFPLLAPSGKKSMVCHRCDVRACNNVNHLYIGDAPSNSSDRWKRGVQDAAVTDATTILRHQFNTFWSDQPIRQIIIVPAKLRVNAGDTTRPGEVIRE